MPPKTKKVRLGPVTAYQCQRCLKPTPVVWNNAPTNPGPYAGTVTLSHTYGDALDTSEPGEKLPNDALRHLFGDDRAYLKQLWEEGKLILETCDASDESYVYLLTVKTDGLYLTTLIKVVKQLWTWSKTWENGSNNDFEVELFGIYRVGTKKIRRLVSVTEHEDNNEDNIFTEGELRTELTKYSDKVRWVRITI